MRGITAIVHSLAAEAPRGGDCVNHIALDDFAAQDAGKNDALPLIGNFPRPKSPWLEASSFRHA
jgi:hypothetical protein